MINNLAKRRGGIASLLSIRASKDHIVTMIKENVELLEGRSADNLTVGGGGGGGNGSDVFFYKRKSSVQIDPHTKRIIFDRESSTSSSDSTSSSYDRRQNDALESEFDALADMGLDRHTLQRLRTLSPEQQEQIVQRLISESEDQVAHTSVELIKSDDLQTLEECLESDDSMQMSPKKRLSKKLSSKSNVCTIS